MNTKDNPQNGGKATRVPLSPKEQPFRFLVMALPRLKGKRTRSHKCPTTPSCTMPAPMVGSNVNDMCSGTCGIGAPHIAYGGLVTRFLKK